MVREKCIKLERSVEAQVGGIVVHHLPADPVAFKLLLPLDQIPSFPALLHFLLTTLCMRSFDSWRRCSVPRSWDKFVQWKEKFVRL